MARPWFIDYWSPAAPDLPAVVVGMLRAPFGAADRYNGPLWTIRLELYGSWLIFGTLFVVRQRVARLAVSGLAALLLRHTYYQAFFAGLAMADAANEMRRSADWRGMPMVGALMIGIGVVVGAFPAYVENTHEGAFFAALPRVPGVFAGYSMIGAVLIVLGTLLNGRVQAVLSASSLQALGRVSFSLYVLHFIAIGSVGAWCVVHLTPRVGYHAAVACAAVVTAAVLAAACAAADRWIDRPFIGAARRVGRAVEAYV